MSANLRPKKTALAKSSFVFAGAGASWALSGNRQQATNSRRKTRLEARADRILLPVVFRPLPVIAETHRSPWRATTAALPSAGCVREGSRARGGDPCRRPAGRAAASPDLQAPP